ncbi:hypothetical protein Ddye_026947 [Dipteronia dyeriana]|uniref:Uncharacterized protein n=1 Tax=Dipteronia dyeriana TaxID=168575 RepID=A0AAD9WQW4_9ROSI|nr:hypothetical protein Ddye_026947 [Dipteronia dyeriana]
MQSMVVHRETLPLHAAAAAAVKPSRIGGRTGNKSCDRSRARKTSSSLEPTHPNKSRSGFVCTCSNNPGSNKCSLHGYLVPRQKLKTLSGNKEIIRRALTPSNRRLTLRFWNFRPTPSRLSIMSTA